MPKVAVIKFPGTNCDEDVSSAFKEVEPGLDVRIVWHKEFRVGDGWDAVVVPGGFSYGDWLRAGAIAARSRAIEELRDSAGKGVPVLGICNGFQVLVEAGLLRGAFLPNEHGRFVCRWVKLKVERARGPWLSATGDGEELDMPVAHGEGRYYVDEGEYLEVVGRVPIIRYAPGYNPNGSVYDIAGIGNYDGSVLGIMPHPERAANHVLTPRGFRPGGAAIFRSIAESLKRGW